MILIIALGFVVGLTVGWYFAPPRGFWPWPRRELPPPPRRSPRPEFLGRSEDPAGNQRSVWWVDWSERECGDTDVPPGQAGHTSTVGASVRGGSVARGSLSPALTIAQEDAEMPVEFVPVQPADEAFIKAMETVRDDAPWMIPPELVRQIEDAAPIGEVQTHGLSPRLSHQEIYDAIPDYSQDPPTATGAGVHDASHAPFDHAPTIDYSNGGVFNMDEFVILDWPPDPLPPDEKQKVVAPPTGLVSLH